MTFTRSIVASVFLIGIVVGAGLASAQELPATKEAALYSITHGFRETSLPLLRRQGVGDFDAASTALLEKLCPAPCASLNRRATGNAVELAYADWSLKIMGDGTAARYQNLDVGKRMRSIGRDPAQKMSSEELVRAGRDYIEANLTSVKTRGLDEQIVPTSIDYLFEGGLDLKTQKSTSAIVANRVVFGRTIRGVPVVGGGGRVVLTFANDGALESFQYDWPHYQIDSVRSVAAIADILDRVHAVIGDRMGVPTSPTTRVQKGGDRTYAVELMPNTVLQKLECGYFDPGVLAREAAAVVQPGCVYHVVYQSDGRRAGFAGAVPAATQIEPDPGWREAVFLRGSSPSQPPMLPGPSRAQ